jgi:hypothetical protein
MVLLRLAEGEDRTPEEIFAASGDPDVDFVGTGAEVNPGGRASMIVDLDVGKYAFVCFVSTSPGQADHLSRGMFAEFVVG